MHASRRWLVREFRYWWKQANAYRPIITDGRSFMGDKLPQWERSIRYRATALRFAQMVADVS